jgi:hypothetical protein
LARSHEQLPGLALFVVAVSVRPHAEQFGVVVHGSCIERVTLQRKAEVVLSSAPAGLAEGEQQNAANGVE